MALVLVMVMGLGSVPAAEIGPAAWPSWRGAGDGVTTDTGLQLVSDAKQVRKVWTSEIQNIPFAWPGGGGGIRNQKMGGGYGSPVVVAGRVHIAWWEPAGEVVDEGMMAKSTDQRREKWLVDADEIIACIDARTGKTLWQQRLSSSGWNHQYNHHCAIYQPVIAEGVLALVGNAGLVHCLDAVSGEVRWQARLGTVTDHADTWQKLGIIEGDGRIPIPKEIRSQLPRWNKTNFNTSPLIVDGMVVCSDQSGGRSDSHALVAFDLRTGQERWRLPDSASGIGSPLIWRHADTNYVVSATPSRAVCVEPKTGTVLWQIEPFGGIVEALRSDEKPHPREGFFGKPSIVNDDPGTPAIAGDILILPPNCGREKKGYGEPWQHGHTAWRLTPEGAALLWRQSRDGFRSTYSSTVIYRDRAFLFSSQGNDVSMVDLLSGEILAKASAGAGGEITFVAGDGRLFGHNIMHTIATDGFTTDRLPVSTEQFTQSFYADGFLFTRGLVDDHGISKGMQAVPNKGAVHCYDLRAR